MLPTSNAIQQAPEKRFSATVTKATVPVPAAPAPRNLVPPISLTAGSAVLSFRPAVPSPSVPPPTVDSTEEAAFPSPAAFDLTNDDDDLTEPLKTIWEDYHCELCSENENQG